MARDTAGKGGTQGCAARPDQCGADAGASRRLGACIQGLYMYTLVLEVSVCMAYVRGMCGASWGGGETVSRFGAAVLAFLLGFHYLYCY